VPTNQVSSSSLLAAAVGPLAQVGPVMRALVTARPAEQHDSQGDHLTKRCSQWVARREVAVGWCPEAG